jgi:hypothetical protein
MKKILLSAALIAAMAMPARAPETNAPPQKEEFTACGFICGIAVIGLGYYLWVTIRNWCDDWLGRTNHPPTKGPYTNWPFNTQPITNKHAISLTAPYGYAPYTLLSASSPAGPWTPEFTVTETHDATTMTMTVWRNGVALATKTGNIKDGVCIIDFGQLATNSSPDSMFMKAQ